MQQIWSTQQNALNLDIQQIGPCRELVLMVMCTQYQCQKGISHREFDLMLQIQWNGTKGSGDPQCRNVTTQQIWPIQQNVTNLTPCSEYWQAANCPMQQIHCMVTFLHLSIDGVVPHHHLLCFTSLTEVIQGMWQVYLCINLKQNDITFMCLDTNILWMKAFN